MLCVQHLFMSAVNVMFNYNVPLCSDTPGPGDQLLDIDIPSWLITLRIQKKKKKIWNIMHTF